MVAENKKLTQLSLVTHLGDNDLIYSAKYTGTSTIADSVAITFQNLTTGLGGGTTFQVNGVNLLSQSTVNFVQSTNMTVANSSGGTITFQSSGGGGSGSAWALVASNTSISGVNHVDFANLGAYSEIYIFVRQITFGSNDVVAFQVSSDNGSTFFSSSGDYVNVGAGGTEANSTLSSGLWSTSATAARTGSADIQAFNIVSFHPTSYPARTDAAGSALSYITQTAALNAIRVLSAGGNNFTGGAIYIFGR